MLPKTAKTYITIVIGCGTAILLFAAASWSSVDVRQFAILLTCVALASAFKIRIPGMESTISPNFVFLLLAMSVCGFSEVVALAATAALVQCLWPGAKRTRAVQVAFSVAALVVSASVAFEISRVVHGKTGWESSVGVVALAGCTYLPLNSALVSFVVGLAAGQPLKQVWRQCYAWAFPYFMAGIACVALATLGNQGAAVWRTCLLTAPVVLLTHFYFQNQSSASLAPEPQKTR